MGLGHSVTTSVEVYICFGLVLGLGLGFKVKVKYPQRGRNPTGTDDDI